jgi:hypothetical protein
MEKAVILIIGEKSLQVTISLYSYQAEDKA